MDNNIEYIKKNLKVYVADVLPKEVYDEEEIKDRMDELENLVNTYGWVVILKKVQKKVVPDYNTYIWAWKLDEIIEDMKREWADILIIWNILKPAQIFNVNEKLREAGTEMKAWDKIDLILKIFERHAKWAEAKLQIELASIKHMWPRIYWMWMELSRQWGWIWSVWIWETNTEIMKRHLREKEKFIRNKLEHYKKVREQHRKWREKKWFKTIWIVWYTNAWKSTLLNALTKKWVLAEDKLFATLWTDIWKMFIQTEDYKWEQFLLNDTIWFIRDLPPSLIDAFASTLEDSIESDLILDVVDCSDRHFDKKIEVVDDILNKIWANQDRIYVFNKSDNLTSEEMYILKNIYKDYNPIFISALEKEWFDTLKSKILDKIKKV